MWLPYGVVVIVLYMPSFTSDDGSLLLEHITWGFLSFVPVIDVWSTFCTCSHWVGEGKANGRSDSNQEHVSCSIDLRCSRSLWSRCILICVQLIMLLVKPCDSWEKIVVTVNPSNFCWLTARFLFFTVRSRSICRCRRWSSTAACSPRMPSRLQWRITRRRRRSRRWRQTSRQGNP